MPEKSAAESGGTGENDGKDDDMLATSYASRMMFAVADNDVDVSVNGAGEEDLGPMTLWRRGN